MKVRDLTRNEFENINLKKVKLSERLAIYLRVADSLRHRLDIVLKRRVHNFEDLVDNGIVFGKFTPEFKHGEENVCIGTIRQNTWYIKDTPENQRLKKVFLSLDAQKVKLNAALDSITGQIRGVRAAITRQANGL